MALFRVKSVFLAVVALQLGRYIAAATGFPYEGSAGCSLGFPSEEDAGKSELVSFPDTSLPQDDVLSNFVQWIFPNINFTCSGEVREWILRVNTTTTEPDDVHRSIPQISTWRPKPSFVLGQYTYEQQSITNETLATVTVANDSTYHYQLSQPVQVQPGDILGIIMPNEAEENRKSVKPFFLDLGPPEANLSIFSCARLGSSDIIFIRHNDQPCGVRTGQLQTRYLPQISVIIGHVDTSPTVSPSSTPATFTSTQSIVSIIPTPTTFPAVTRDPDTTDPPTTDALTTVQNFPGEPATSNQTVGVVIGAILAAIALVLIVALVILLVLIICRRRRERQKLYDVPASTEPQNLDNPVYTTDYRNGTNPSGVVYATTSPTQLASPHPLETDIVAEHYEFSPDMVPPINEHQYELEPAEQDEPAYQDPAGYAVPSVNVPKAGTMSQPYEVPLSALSTLNSTRDESSLDRHIYSVLEGGIYVPTEEERRFLTRSMKSTSSAATSNGTGTGVFDDNIYARMSKKYKKRLDEGQFFEQEEVYWKPASSQTALYHQLAKKKYREILRQQIHIIKHLGAGQFGTVSKGVWESHYGSIEVAVKMLQPRARKEEKVKFLQEAAIMGQFLHPNIVKLHGVVTVDQPVMIVLEYMKNGDLREHLLAQRPKEDEAAASDLPQRFLKFCREIASGMNYLSNKAFVHRDLAARNILVCEDEVCKIGDFGMSRDLEDNNYYITHGGKIPVKWTAPEALHFRRYSTASDVWSYGCVMYEIWSLGHKPFEAYSNIQAMQMIGSGYRLPPPPGCPKPLYSLMIRCWHSDATVRPMFSAIFKMLGHSDSHLLNWSDRDKQVHPQASYLGAPLEAGDELYIDLQDYYLDEPSKRQ